MSSTVMNEKKESTDNLLHKTNGVVTEPLQKGVNGIQQMDCKNMSSLNEDKDMKTNIEALLNIKFPIWKNRDLFCWLNAALGLLLHSETLSSYIKKNSDKECEIIRQFHRYKKILQLANTDNFLNNKTEIDKLLYEMQENAYTHLKDRLGCEPGKEDSAMLTTMNLLKDSKEVENLFNLTSRWQECDDISHKTSFTNEYTRAIVTIGNEVPDDFSLTSPYVLKPCTKCKKDKMKRKLLFDKLPHSIILHFLNGLQHTNFPSLDFSFQEKTYFVRGVVQWSKINKKKHFTTWIRDPTSNYWLNCNDLSVGLRTFSSKIPDMKPSEVHIIMWEDWTPQRPTFLEICLSSPSGELMQKIKSKDDGDIEYPEVNFTAESFNFPKSLCSYSKEHRLQNKNLTNNKCISDNSNKDSSMKSDNYENSDKISPLKLTEPTLVSQSNGKDFVKNQHSSNSKKITTALDNMSKANGNISTDEDTPNSSLLLVQEKKSGQMNSSLSTSVENFSPNTSKNNNLIVSSRVALKGCVRAKIPFSQSLINSTEKLSANQNPNKSTPIPSVQLSIAKEKKELEIKDPNLKSHETLIYEDSPIIPQMNSGKKPDSSVKRLSVDLSMELECQKLVEQGKTSNITQKITSQQVQMHNSDICVSTVPSSLDLQSNLPQFSTPQSTSNKIGSKNIKQVHPNANPNKKRISLSQSLLKTDSTTEDFDNKKRNVPIETPSNKEYGFAIPKAMSNKKTLRTPVSKQRKPGDSSKVSQESSSNLKLDYSLKADDVLNDDNNDEKNKISKDFNSRISPFSKKLAEIDRKMKLNEVKNKLQKQVIPKKPLTQKNLYKNSENDLVGKIIGQKILNEKIKEVDDCQNSRLSKDAALNEVKTSEEFLKFVSESDSVILVDVASDDTKALCISRSSSEEKKMEENSSSLKMSSPELTSSTNEIKHSKETSGEVLEAQSLQDATLKEVDSSFSEDLAFRSKPSVTNGHKEQVDSIVSDESLKTNNLEDIKNCDTVECKEIEKDALKVCNESGNISADSEEVIECVSTRQFRKRPNKPCDSTDLYNDPQPSTSGYQKIKKLENKQRRRLRSNSEITLQSSSMTTIAPEQPASQSKKQSSSPKKKSPSTMNKNNPKKKSPNMANKNSSKKKSPNMMSNSSPNKSSTEEISTIVSTKMTTIPTQLGSLGEKSLQSINNDISNNLSTADITTTSRISSVTTTASVQSKSNVRKRSFQSLNNNNSNESLTEEANEVQVPIQTNEESPLLYQSRITYSKTHSDVESQENKDPQNQYDFSVAKKSKIDESNSTSIGLLTRNSVRSIKSSNSLVEDTHLTSKEYQKTKLSHKNAKLSNLNIGNESINAIEKTHKNDRFTDGSEEMENIVKAVNEFHSAQQCKDSKEHSPKSVIGNLKQKDLKNVPKIDLKNIQKIAMLTSIIQKRNMKEEAPQTSVKANLTFQETSSRSDSNQPIKNDKLLPSKSEISGCDKLQESSCACSCMCKICSRCPFKKSKNFFPKYIMKGVLNNSIIIESSQTKNDIVLTKEDINDRLCASPSKNADHSSLLERSAPDSMQGLEESNTQKDSGSSKSVKMVKETDAKNKQKKHSLRSSVNQKTSNQRRESVRIQKRRNEVILVDKNSPCGKRKSDITAVENNFSCGKRKSARKTAGLPPKMYSAEDWVENPLATSSSTKSLSLTDTTEEEDEASLTSNETSNDEIVQKPRVRKRQKIIKTRTYTPRRLLVGGPRNPFITPFILFSPGAKP